MILSLNQRREGVGVEMLVHYRFSLPYRETTLIHKIKSAAVDLK